MQSTWSRSSAAVSLTWLMFSVLGMCLTACGGVDPVVEIGLVAPFEGRHRELGYDVIYSARLVIREVNAAGGIGPFRVELVALDDFGDPEMAQRTAEALVLDPDVVAVVGHWLTETTEAAAAVYEANGLAYVAGGEGTLGPFPAAELPAEFRATYEAVTPFDEQTGDFAGAAYDGMSLVIEALRIAWTEDGKINRDSVNAALKEAAIRGITGPVSVP